MKIVKFPQYKKEIKNLYNQAFPPSERKTFALMACKRHGSHVEILPFSHNQKFIGFAITMVQKELVLIDYLAISETERSQGFGSQALSLLTERYPEQKIVLEIETPNEKAANNQQRLARQNFYLRNGFQETGIDFILRKDNFLSVLTNQLPLSFTEFKSIYQQTYGLLFTKYLKIKKIN